MKAGLSEHEDSNSVVVTSAVDNKHDRCHCDGCESCSSQQLERDMALQTAAVRRR